MATQLNVLFMALESRTNAKGETPVYCRLTLNQRQQRFMIGCSVPINIWEQDKQKAKGKSEKAISVNQHIKNILQKVQGAETKLLKQGESFEVEDIIAQIQGKDKAACRTLLQLYTYRFKQMEKLKGKEYAPSSLSKYSQLANAVKNFLQDTYHADDVPLSKVNSVFITNLELYLKTEKSMKQVSVNKVLQKLKSIMKMAVDYNWIAANPFPGHSFKHEKPDVIYLTVDELEKLQNYQFAQPRLNRVRDIFLFSVYTGLHYIDAMSLTHDNIIKGVDGKEWIKYNRQKTGKWIHIPLLNKAKYLLQQFQTEMHNSNYLVPRISNQKINSYLKEVADIANLSIPLTHKVARKTFGSVLLYLNVPMKVVSELMGHSTVLITERHYAQVELKKLGEIMSSVDSQL